MISVIIPVYNVEDYLHVCLNSILKQSYQDFEIICIDDASTDSSLEILEYFTRKDSRIKILKNETKKGLKYCKIEGLRNSQGKYITFLNSDGWLSFNALKVFIEKFNEEKLDIIILSDVDYKLNLDKSSFLEFPMNVFCSKSFLSNLNSNSFLNENKISILDSDLLEKTDEFRKQDFDLSIYDKKLNNEISILKNEIEKLNINLNDSKKIVEKLKNNELILQKKLGEYRKPHIIEKIINKDYSNLTIAIKSPHPKGTTHWGDLFFSKALKKSFKKLGFNVILQERENWYDEKEIDIALVLRGLVDYNPDYSNINIMWNISHPELISKEEYEKYDQVFISSKKYVNKLKNKVNTNISSLLQCTDPEVFYPEVDENIKDEILFVGVTRGVYREIIRDILKTNHDVSIYGMGWEEYIDKKYIKDQFIPNDELHKYYSSCKILLNDHWEEMRDEDFPSNRLFDALACGTFVISDKIPSADTLFEGSIVTYDDVDDLNEKVDYYLTHEDERIKLAEKGKKIVLENHTFDNRVQEILYALKKLSQ